MKRRCANIGGTLQPITSPLTVFARDDLFTNKSHPRRKSEGRSKIERVPSGPMQIYPPLYPTHSPEWQRYTIHTDSFFRGQVWKFNIFRQALQSGFTRGNHEDVWENMYGDARGILTGGGKGNFVILWFPGFHEFEWNRVVRQDKSCSCAIFKLRLKLKFFFLSLSLSSLYFLPVFALVSFSNSSIKIYIRWKLEIEISIFQFGIFVHVFFEILQRN